MASSSRRARTAPKGPKMTIPGKAGLERFRYCIKHDTKMSPIRVYGSKVIQYTCKEGCRLSRGEAILK